MPLSLNEIRDRAHAFAKEWEGETSERAEAQSFWNDFFHVFGKKRRSVAVYEQKAKRFTGSARGRIDVFWPGVMLAEHKSAGVDLDIAFDQATDYFAGLTEAEKPRYVLVSDFRRFRLHDLEDAAGTVEFALADLHREIGRFGFISGYQSRSYKEEDPVNVLAAERMGKLYDALRAAGYQGHALELLLVRLLFCLFADDTGIFPRHAFHDLIDQRTGEDGGDLGGWLARLFQALNTPADRRQTTLDEQLAELPYVNGRLFEEMLPLADFNAPMRGLLLDASALDWSRISPAIFGSMFQSVMDARARRNLGAHYTSEKNILKLIGPLFLDGLTDELDKAGFDEKKLAQLHRKLATLKFLDPACGCGNFLVIAYRELRRLELEVLKRQFAKQQSVLAHVQDHVLVDVDQFFGIEIEEFPAQIAQVAMWLMDHQMNLRVAEQFGENVVRLPLKKSAAILHGNALRIDWNDVVPAGDLDYILGNPPFVGKKEQNAEQKADMAAVFKSFNGAGVLDLVTAWYVKASELIRSNPEIRAAFVSTNSITQGEQVGVLWSALYRQGMHIQFAHRTFQWSSEARGKAAVHCVIVGFGHYDVAPKRLFEYSTPLSEPSETSADSINPYLVNAPAVLLEKRMRPISDALEMDFGSKAADFGHLTLSVIERDELISKHPEATSFVREFIGSEEFINNSKRYVLWLKEVPPDRFRNIPFVKARLEAVRTERAKSVDANTRRWADMPALFQADRQPSAHYLLVPKVSSERRRYVPLGFCSPELIVNPSVLVVPHARLYDFGVMQSLMHMSWMRSVAGRMKSDYQYSNTIVYNNFPWPELPEATSPDDRAQDQLQSDSRLRGNDGQGPGHKLGAAIEAAAQGVLDARALFPDATLADLYDPLTMPPALVKAHATLDKAVDAAYIAAEKAAGRKLPKLGTDAERVAFLFERYQALTSLLPAGKARTSGRRKEKKA